MMLARCLNSETGRQTGRRAVADNEYRGDGPNAVLKTQAAPCMRVRVCTPDVLVPLSNIPEMTTRHVKSCAAVFLPPFVFFFSSFQPPLIHSMDFLFLASNRFIIMCSCMRLCVDLSSRHRGV